MPHDEDLELARRVVARDRRAAEQFFDEYFARLYRFVALRLNQTAAIEDVVQESMIKAMSHMQSYRGEAALFTWLCGIGRNEISNHYQRYGRKEAPLLRIDDDPRIRAALESLDFADTDSTERAAIEQLVHLTLDYLPDRYSKALEWKYLEGASVEEIAGRLKLGVTAAQSLLARARGAFRESYRDLSRELGASA